MEKSKFPISVVLAKGLPYYGEPNSKDTALNPDGSLKQERKCGPLGEPVPIPEKEDTSYSSIVKVILLAGITALEVISYCYGMPVDIPGN